MKYIKFTWRGNIKYGKTSSLEDIRDYFVFVSTLDGLEIYISKNNASNIMEISKEEYLAVTIMES